MYPSVIGPSKRFAYVIGPSKRFTPTLEDVVAGLGQVLLLGARRRGGGRRLGKPHTLNPAPCTLHPAPCTLNPAPCTLKDDSKP